MPMRVDAYSAAKATPQLQPSHPKARRHPRSRAARTRKTARKTKTYGRSRTVPASKIGKPGTSWTMVATLADFPRIFNAAQVPTRRGLC